MPMGPNNALDTVAPGPSRPLQLSSKGRAGLRRAGQRKRYTSRIGKRHVRLGALLSPDAINAR